MSKAAEGCEAILHIAGIAEEKPPDLTFEKINVDGTRNLVIEAQRAGVRRFVYVSSLGADRGGGADGVGQGTLSQPLYVFMETPGANREFSRGRRRHRNLVTGNVTGATFSQPGGVYFLKKTK